MPQLIAAPFIEPVQSGVLTLDFEEIFLFLLTLYSLLVAGVIIPTFGGYRKNIVLGGLYVLWKTTVSWKKKRTLFSQLGVRCLKKASFSWRLIRSFYCS